MRGLSLRELSEALGGCVSHAALQKYEKGRMKPDSDVLVALSETLSLRPDYFFHRQPVSLSGIEFRKRTTFGKKKQARMLEEARDFFERYLEIEDILDAQAPKLPREDLRMAAPEDLGEAAEAAARKLRASWKLGLSPLANVSETLEDHGVKLVGIEAARAFDGLSGWADASPVIVIAGWLNEDLPRKRLTLLHELGHLVLRLPEGLDKKIGEAASYRFAGAMLIPKEAFFEEFGRKRRYPHISLQELAALKEQWGISIDAIMRRAKDLGILAKDSYARFCVDAGASGLRTHEPGKWPGSETSNRFRQLVHRAAAQRIDYALESRRTPGHHTPRIRPRVREGRMRPCAGLPCRTPTS